MRKRHVFLRGERWEDVRRKRENKSGWKLIAGSAVLQVDKKIRQRAGQRKEACEIQRRWACGEEHSMYFIHRSVWCINLLTGPSRDLRSKQIARPLHWSWAPASSVFLRLGPSEISFILLSSEMTDAFICCPRLQSHNTLPHKRRTTLKPQCCETAAH